MHIFCSTEKRPNFGTEFETNIIIFRTMYLLYEETN